jgi:hypothetical protein
MEQVPISLPAAILPSVSGVLSAGCTSQFVRVQPNNQSTIVSAESGTLSASTTVPTIVPFPAVPLEFTIPSGSSKNVFIDTSKSTLQFRVRYEVSTASTADYTIVSYLQNSACSWFERLTEKVNGMVTDDQVGWDIACNSDLNWAYDAVNRDANVLNMGFRGEQTALDNANFNQGHPIPIITKSAAGAISASSNYFSYAVPLKSAMIGVDAKSMFPIGRAGKVDLTLYTPNTAPITIISTAAGGTGAKVKITMDQIFIELFYLTLDDQSASLLPSPSSPWSMAGVTHRVGSGQLPAAGGSVSVQVPLRVKSARSLSTRFVDSLVDTTGSVSGKYDSKCPLVTAMSYYLAGQKRVPNVPHSTQYGLANVFNHTMQAYYDGGMDRLKAKCGFAQDGFATYIKTDTAPTAANGFDQSLITAGSTTYAGSLCGFEFAEDLRLASTSNFLNGTDLTSSNSYLEINQSASYPKNIQYLTFIAKADIIYVVLPNGNVEVRV